jgi:CRISPR-associated endonuclease/helicase Cas3
MPEVLLAKKPIDPHNPHPSETLAGHSQKVMESFITMFGTLGQPSRLARQWLRFFKLDDSCLYTAFFTNCLAACGLHDLGKANSGFQEAVQGKRDSQVIRHEHLSGLLLSMPEIRDWLKTISLLDEDVVISAVISHHLRAEFETFAQPLNLVKQFSVFPESIHELLNTTANALAIPDPGLVNIDGCWSFEAELGFYLAGLCDGLKRRQRKFRCKLRDQQDLLSLLLAVRSALIAADSAGSGLTREKEDLPNWLKEAFDEDLLLDGQAIEEKVIAPRIRQIKASGKEFIWSGFQNAAETLPSRALLLAPCGSGKTLAAWRWIKARLSERPAARAIFLYPTRGTATEGFRDYVSWAPEAEAALIHGTSSYELQGMFENPDDQPKDERYGKDFTTEDRLFAIGYWQRRIFSATVDQFLGFMQHGYRSICLMPLLVDSVVVIDEVHSFDRSLFSALKRFLQGFNVPVLCMTASLPSRRCQDLKEECGLSESQVDNMDNNTFKDLQKMADMPRYRVNYLEEKGSAQEIARKAFEDGQRVLWVVNTIDRCQKLALDFKDLNALCYHSRFRLEDRKKRHDDVVAAFQQKKDTPLEPALAITTQVCEMSLDLDAQVLITETAPITSLIQRMGRCNRHAKPHQDNQRIGDVYLYQPEDSKPYDKDDLVGLSEFIESLNGKDASQSYLQELLEKYGPAGVEVDRYAAFLESGPWAMAGEETLRDEQGFTMTSVLDNEIERYLELRKQRKPADGLLLPVPRRFGRCDRRLGRFPLVARHEYYSTRYGFSIGQRP